MNTLEEIRQELIKRGNPATSKCIPMVLDIVTESSKYTELEKIDEELARKKNELECLGSKYHLKQLQLEEELGDHKDTLEAYVQYIQRWYELLMQCETPQGRDAMRAAQVFVNTVEVVSCYDRTAFIVGLSSILAGEEMAPIDSLKQINPKIFDAMSLPPKRKEKNQWR